MTFGNFGSASIWARSSKSAAMHSIPAAVSCSRRPFSLKRATPTMRLLGAARLASRARLGPIFPPTPRMMRSPSSLRSSSATSAPGVVMTSSRCSTSRKRSGSVNSDIAARGIWQHAGRLYNISASRENRRMAEPRIKTTVVGSYPFPDWLGALPSEQALVDATRVVIHTQEQAGIDLVCDGELYRFDVNHPETNGMIEYFVKPMDGVRSGVKFDELVIYRNQPATKFRTRPPAVVDGPIGPGTLDLPQACARAKRLTSRPFKFTLTGPHMLAKMLYDVHYRSLPDLTMAIADALAEQVRHLDADVVQVDEANLPGSPDEWEWAAAAMNRVLDSVQSVPCVHLCFGNYGGQSIQKGTWAQLINYLNALHVDHIVMETAHR